MERVPTKWAAKAKSLRDDAIPPETGNKIDIINFETLSKGHPNPLHKH